MKKIFIIGLLFLFSCGENSSGSNSSGSNSSGPNNSDLNTVDIYLVPYYQDQGYKILNASYTRGEIVLKLNKPLNTEDLHLTHFFDEDNKLINIKKDLRGYRNDEEYVMTVSYNDDKNYLIKYNEPAPHYYRFGVVDPRKFIDVVIIGRGFSGRKEYRQNDSGYSKPHTVISSYDNFNINELVKTNKYSLTINFENRSSLD